MNNSIIIFVLYFLYIQSCFIIIGVRKQIMSSKECIECPICGIRWAKGKSFSLHYTSCSRKLLTRKKVNDLTLPCASVPVMLQSSTSKANSSSLKSNHSEQNLEDESIIETLSKQNEGNDMDFENQNNDICNVYEDKDISASKNIINLTSSEYSQDQMYLIKKEQDYLGDTHLSKNYWPEETLCQIDLMKKLKELDCPIKAYDGIMDWAKKWTCSSQSIFESGNINVRRKTLINRLSGRYHLNGLKPITKTISFNVENNQHYNVYVSCFDFKEQLLSLLRDEELMDPKNLCLDGHNPGVEPIFDQDYISEINHGEWYKSVYEYYFQRYGKETNRVICGIILSIDKTHTDVKGKLCLEPVKFSLSIFNTETRRKKYSAWRRLGYINDLDTYRIAKVFGSEPPSTDNIRRRNECSTEVPVAEKELNEESQNLNVNGTNNIDDDDNLEVSVV